jgi:RNA methyltransferase, TrmH family
VTEVITSPANWRVKRLVALRDRKDRDAEDVFVLEGYRAVRRALDSHVPLNELYICPEMFLGTNEGQLIADAQGAGAELIELSAQAFRKCAYRDRPEGLLAVAPQWHYSLADFAVRLEHSTTGRPPLLLVVDAIEKPGNLGAMLRTADAAGCDAVIVCEAVTDVFNPNIVRASTGALFSVAVINEPNAETLRQWLRNRNIAIVVTTPDTARLHWDADLTGPVAIVMGSEMHGLPDHWLHAPDVTAVRIPMTGLADSLNVATASTITLFEAVRQRAR